MPSQDWSGSRRELNQVESSITDSVLLLERCSPTIEYTYLLFRAGLGRLGRGCLFVAPTLDIGLSRHGQHCCLWWWLDDDGSCDPSWPECCQASQVLSWWQPSGWLLLELHVCPLPCQLCWIPMSGTVCWHDQFTSVYNAIHAQRSLVSSSPIII